MKTISIALSVLGLVIIAFCHEDHGNVGVPLPTENVKLDLKNRITKDHVLEELQQQINTKKKEDMSHRELQFHYFKLHDFDNNNLLDGLEIVKAIQHGHDDQGSESQSYKNDDDLINVVDSVMKMDDENNDGFISFYEFMSAQDQDAG